MEFNFYHHTYCVSKTAIFGLRLWCLSTNGFSTVVYYKKNNLQATKLFIVTSATKGGWLTYRSLRFSVRFKIFYRVIQRFRSGPIPFHSVYHSIKSSNKVLFCWSSSLCGWHPIIHIFFPGLFFHLNQKSGRCGMKICPAWSAVRKTSNINIDGSDKYCNWFSWLMTSGGIIFINRKSTY